jgi:hypothetical protein
MLGDRMTSRRHSSLLLMWTVFTALPVAAQSGEPPPLLANTFGARWEVGLAAQLGYGVSGRRCERLESDVIGCSELGLIAFEFTPRYRFEPEWSIGGLAQLGKGDAFSLLRFGAEARFHPLGPADVEPSLGLDAGAAILIDALPMSELGSAETFTTVAPAFGASAGVDMALGESVSVGLIVRLVLVPLGQRDDIFSREPSYDTQLLFSAGLSGVYRFGS